MIEIKHLDIQFKQQVIFKNANFKTCPGKITGIIGKWLWKDDVFKSIDLSIQESNTFY